jgi:hypothetical protein
MAYTELHPICTQTAPEAKREGNSEIWRPSCANSGLSKTLPPFVVDSQVTQAGQEVGPRPTHSEDRCGEMLPDLRLPAGGLPQMTIRNEDRITQLGRQAFPQAGW